MSEVAGPFVVYGERGLGRGMRRRYICEARELRWAQSIAKRLAGAGDNNETFHVTTERHWPILELMAANREAGSNED